MINEVILEDMPIYLELNELSPGRTKKTEINIFYERTADKN